MHETETNFEIEMNMRSWKKYPHFFGDFIEFEDRPGTWQIVGMGTEGTIGKPKLSKGFIAFRQVAWWK